MGYFEICEACTASGKEWQEGMKEKIGIFDEQHADEIERFGERERQVLKKGKCLPI